MSIASRINEMTEHLRNDWNSIDKLGLDITEENSNDNLDKNIENIAPVLSKFYNQVSDKTDLAKNGVVGRTSQDGDPTPENPVEVNNLSGDVEYKVRGQGISEIFPLSLKSRNLFDKDNANYVNGWIDGTTMRLNTINGNRMFYIPCKPNTTYTISRSVITSSFRTTTYDSTPFPTVTSSNVNYTVPTVIQNNSGTTLTITTNANAKYLVVHYGKIEDTNLNETLATIQVEYGNSASLYEPYYDIELCNISDYKDRIYSQNGEFYLEKKTDKVVFDGSESWSINTSYTYNVFYRTLDNYARISNAQTTYCEYYKGIENAGGIANFGNNYNNSIGVRTANDNIKDIYISNNSITSASDFKTWLSTHNTVVYYVLATPTTTEITEENYPTLYSQLQAIQEFLTKYKINKEFLLDYSSPEIEY